ncbi:TetR/AcrR family transcriptional regulator [Actinoplanes sp. DH11]|uniref:TetR/AcrR family transcriptional regulator n=1 Tax=Actinoplanes sp. DH11 TaxID=2857011 RepID=UPI001E50B0C0|nr:TetR/AcrR family transcriptional regulator [Actinoplanes sp. DH11]
MGRVSQAQAKQNRERIVATAARLFRERGIGGVSVADVMAEAGLTHGGFYKHFASKDALAAEAVGEAFSEQAAALGLTFSYPRADTPLRYVGHAHADGRDATTPTSTEAVHPQAVGDAPLSADTVGPECPASHDASIVATTTSSASGDGETIDSFTSRTTTPTGRAALLDAYLSADHRDHAGAGCPSAGFGSDVARAAGGEETRRAYAAGVEAFARHLGTSGEPDLAALSTMVGALILSRATAGTDLSDRILAAARAALPDDSASPLDNRPGDFPEHTTSPENGPSPRRPRTARPS